MVFNLDKAKPICPQIYEQFCLEIAKGNIKPDEKLPSVREVALMAAVNPNTVQKAFEMLEGSELVYSLRGSGWFASDKKEDAKKIVDELIKSKTAQYIESMRAFGLDNAQIKKYVKELANE